MISLNLCKSTIISLLLFTTTSAFAGEMSCKSLLTETKEEIQLSRAEARQNLSQDYRALEITASIALAFELKTIFGGVPWISGIPTGIYKSVPRIKYSERELHSFTNYDFESIKPADKARILENLPKLMEEVLEKSRLGRDFEKMFTRSMTEGLLKRNEILLKAFLEENFRAIAFNAAKMPALPFSTKVFLFAKRGLKWGGPLALIAGAAGEVVYPSLLVEYFRPDLLADSMGFLPVLGKMGVNTLGVYPFLAIPIGFLRSGRERLDAFSYDFEAGEEIRNAYVDEAVDPN